MTHLITITDVKSNEAIAFIILVTIAGVTEKTTTFVTLTQCVTAKSVTTMKKHLSCWQNVSLLQVRQRKNIRHIDTMCHCYKCEEDKETFVCDREKTFVTITQCVTVTGVTEKKHSSHWHNLSLLQMWRKNFCHVDTLTPDFWQKWQVKNICRIDTMCHLYKCDEDKKNTCHVTPGFWQE